ncbi:MAG: FadR/GntR family transcriptional regulator [Sphaerochaetaceae bacterium]|nr:FadR/GntR family transcriptional regulator [Sphaerochaetaceae bacterium]
MSPSEKIFEEILNLITAGVYKDGDRIPSENELKEKHGVSRNTVRLALNKLSTLGIIETKRGDGSFIKAAKMNVPLKLMVSNLIFEKQDFDQILEFRRAIEIEAIKLAADRATPKDLGKLRQVLKKMQEMAAIKDMAAFADLDHEMHILFARASQNKMFDSMIEIIHSILTADMRKLLERQGQDIDSLFYHESILFCLENHKPTEAAYFMERHMDVVIERVHQKI